MGLSNEDITVVGRWDAGERMGMMWAIWKCVPIMSHVLQIPHLNIIVLTKYIWYAETGKFNSHCKDVIVDRRLKKYTCWTPKWQDVSMEGCFTDIHRGIRTPLICYRDNSRM